MLSKCAPCCRTAAGLRSMLPQSSITTVRSPMSAGAAWMACSSAGQRYSRGSGRSLDEMNISELLPSAVSSPCMPISEPKASPSGCSWVATTKLVSARMRSSTSRRVCSIDSSALMPVHPLARLARYSSCLSTIDLGLDQRVHAQRAVGGVVIGELKCRRSLERQLARDAPLQIAVGAAQPCQRVVSHLALAEHAHVYARMAQVRACLDIGHGHKSHPRVLQV